MPLRGVLEGGSTINLVPSHTTHGTAQILSAVIGGLGAAFFGAGLGPYVSRSTPLPIEAVRAIADACATKGVHCEVLEIGQPHMGGWLIVGGLILIGVQVAVFFLTTPGRQRDPSPALRDRLGSGGSRLS
jgi:hypothetical protein